jgi:hypothetical protein
VLALRAQGLSQRQIAEEVFGDARCRGRVERILRTPAGREAPVAAAAEKVEFDFEQQEAVGEDLSGVAELVTRYERALLESEAEPSLADLERLLRIKRELASAAQFGRLRALTAEPR